MAAALEDTVVSYEDLADIEKEFDEVETEIIRQQVKLSLPLYERRHALVSQIPNFWPLVFEQAPPDIDQYVQPSDSALLLSSLTNLEVSHFEFEAGGDPRSISIKFGFSENEYFEDKVLEKKFWWRRANDGWTGLVSEPVSINWKKGKDLTQGLLSLVCKAWEVEQKAGGMKTGDMSAEQKALKKKIEATGMGGLSFFAWFGFIGRRISVEESVEATKKEQERREKKRKGEEVEDEEDDEDDIDEAQMEAEELAMELEIFADGDDLAVAVADDLWPSAIKYFTQAQEQDALSDADFESDDDEDEEDDGDEAPELLDAMNDGDAPPAKKRRS